MNYIKEVVEKVLPVGIGEEFNIRFKDGNYCEHNPFKFTGTSLLDKNGWGCPAILGQLLVGDYTIEKIPFTPKVGDEYWTYSNGIKSCIGKCIWNNICYDKERKLLGIVFRTRQEAKDYLATWEKRLEGEQK